MAHAVLERAKPKAREVNEIRPNSVLPARREPITLTTSDGLHLIGELAMPEAVTPVATIICLHPLPTHGGMMDSHVYRKMAWRLPALADFAILRFNTRGTESVQGRSEGEFDACGKEQLDLQAAIAFVQQRGLPDPWLVGWSFGSDVVLKYGNVDPVQAAILLSPALRFSTEADLLGWAASGRPITALVPEHDEYVKPDEARERFAVIPQLTVIGVDGAKHLWVGEQYVYTVLDMVTRMIRGANSPLPRTWDGPMTKQNDLPTTG